MRETQYLKLSIPDATDVFDEQKFIAEPFQKIDEQLAQTEQNFEKLFKKTGGKISILEYENHKSGDNWLPAFQKLCDEIVLTGKKMTIEIPSNETFKMYGTLNIDVSYHQFTSKGAILDFSEMTSGVALNLNGSITPPYTQTHRIFEGIEIKGNGRSGSVVGIKMHTPTPMGDIPAGNSHIEFGHLNLHDFGVGIEFGSQAYIVSFYHADIHFCGKAINHPPSVNSGERMNFSNVTFFGNNIIADLKHTGSDYFFDNCSLDYNELFMDVKCKVFIDNSHIEMRRFNDYLFKTSGGNAGYIVTNSLIGCYEPPVGSFEVFFVGHVNDYIVIENCVIFNLPNRYLVSGTGNVRIRSLHGHASANNFLPSRQLSLLPDPTLDGSNAIRQFAVTTTGTATVAIDNTVSFSGTQSLKFNKLNAGETCRALIEFPMKPQERAYIEFKHKYENVVKGVNDWDTWQVQFAYIDQWGTVLQQSEIYFNTGAISDFTTVYSNYLQNSQAPRGTSRLRVNFSMHGSGTGTAWIDDIYINIC